MTSFSHNEHTAGNETRDNGLPAAFTYRILPGSMLAPSESLSLLGDERDMERAVLLVSPTTPAQQNSVARYTCLPMQAIPQGMAVPDLVAEVYDGMEHLTTLHFCTLWRVVPNDADLLCFERVSFPRPQLASLYNRQERLHVCPSCHRLHRHACALIGTKSLEQALVLTGLALSVHDGYVYLVSGEMRVTAVDTLFHGKVYWYAITGLAGLQACYGFTPAFTKLELCTKFLVGRAVPVQEGWTAVEEPLSFLPSLRHTMRREAVQDLNAL
jgi:hypothetical protein